MLNLYRVHIKGRKNPELDAIRNYDNWESAWRDIGFGISFCDSVAKYWIEIIKYETPTDKSK